MTRAWLPVVLGLIVLMPLSGSVEAAWGPPVPISLPVESPLATTAAAADGLTVYAVWSDVRCEEVDPTHPPDQGAPAEAEGTVICISRNRLQGAPGYWSAPCVIPPSESPGHSLTPDIASFRGTVFVVWAEADPTWRSEVGPILMSDVWAVRMVAWTGACPAWHGPLAIGYLTDDDLRPSVATDGDQAHIAFIGATPLGYGLYYLDWDGEDLADPRNRVIPLTYMARVGPPDIAVSGPGHQSVTVIWACQAYASDRQIVEIEATWSRDGGRTWSKTYTQCPNPFSGGPDTDSRFPSLASTGNALHATWTEMLPSGPQIHYARSHDAGASWTAPRMLSDPIWSYGMSHAAAWGEVVTVVFTGWGSGRTPVLHSVESHTGGQSWFPQDLVTRSGWDAWHSIAVSARPVVGRGWGMATLDPEFHLISVHGGDAEPGVVHRRG